MKNKVTFVTGICGSGKSNTAQQISFWLRNCGERVRWLHEECRDNPLRRTKHNLKKSGCTSIDQYIEFSIEVWSEFISRISRDDLIYVVDGYIFQSTVLNLFNDKFPDEAIQKYFRRFCETIRPLDPLIINLYRKNLRQSFSNVWRERGDRWKRVSIDIPLSAPEEDVDYAKYEKDGLLEWKAFQQLNARLLEESDLRYLRIDTSEGKWNSYYARILQEFGHNYEDSENPVVADQSNYTGVYTNAEDTSHIVIKEVNGEMYCEIFFPFMRLIPMSDTEFYIRGLPIVLRFTKDGSGQVTSLQFVDDYHWGKTGKSYAKSAIENAI